MTTDDAARPDPRPHCYSDQTPTEDNCMSDPARIDPLSVATAEKATPPGHGGWVPPPWFPLAAGIAAGALGSAAPVVATLGGPAGLIVAALLAGLAAGLGAYAGTRSAGPRAPQ